MLTRLADDGTRDPVRWIIRNAPRLLLAALLMRLFVTGVQTQWMVIDDAFISFRYSDHMARGLGLVWNPGEAVEGYSNFLWVLLMAGVIALGGAPTLWADLVGIAAGAFVLVAVVRLGYRVAGDDPRSRAAAWIPALWLVLNRSFLAWCTGGLETMPVVAFVLGAFWLHFRERDRNADWPIGSALLAAVATGLRPDAALMAIALLGTFAVDRLRQRADLRPCLRWALIYAVPIGAHLLWRQHYYGEWVPNTFHAKVNGLWFAQGFRYLGLAVNDFVAYPVLALCAVAMVRARYEHALLGGAALLHLIYITAIGGGVFEFRFLVLVMPMLAWLGARGVAVIMRRLSPRPMAPYWVGTALTGIVVLGNLEGLRPINQTTRHQVDGLPNVRGYGRQRVEEAEIFRELIDAGTLPRDLHIALAGAGAVPYYTGWAVTDTLGLSDRVIAQSPVEERSRIGHEHAPTEDYLMERGVEWVELTSQLVFAHVGCEALRAFAKTTDALTSHCLEVETSRGPRYILVGTYLNEVAFDARFPHVKRRF